ncbi:hypothetical protein J3458_001105 [Metarhizium acridum]|uniref:uncharacterized protein n=1 Tax=Metarhizium acridum TaxID=92637 RepID=UPI001C6C7D98|nr:hypothetical protein J3458_001105 [Metarhizium acridum]
MHALPPVHLLEPSLVMTLKGQPTSIDRSTDSTETKSQKKKKKKKKKKKLLIGGLGVSDGRDPKRRQISGMYQAFKPNRPPAGSPVGEGLGAALGTEDSSALSNLDVFFGC